jgi:hypothetical protein
LKPTFFWLCFQIVAFMNTKKDEPFDSIDSGTEDSQRISRHKDLHGSGTADCSLVEDAEEEG